MSVVNLNRFHGSQGSSLELAVFHVVIQVKSWICARDSIILNASAPSLS
jgi:hypothetical protein